MAESSPLEAAAKAIHRIDCANGFSPGWDVMTPSGVERYREQARAAIAAYEAEQPHCMHEQELADVLGDVNWRDWAWLLAVAKSRSDGLREVELTDEQVEAAAKAVALGGESDQERWDERWARLSGSAQRMFRADARAALLAARATSVRDVDVEAEQATPDPIPSADWSSAWAQLTGYVQQAVEDGEGIDAASLLRYLVELKSEALAPVLAHLKGETR